MGKGVGGKGGVGGEVSKAGTPESRDAARHLLVPPIFYLAKKEEKKSFRVPDHGFHFHG